MDAENLVIRAYETADLPQMIHIWNEVVREGNAFPQTDLLDEKSAKSFFASQTVSAVAQDKRSGRIAGLYICTQTISAGAAISQTQVMLSLPICADLI